jgi:manganese/iron transport system substrate-binding protein
MLQVNLANAYTGQKAQPVHRCFFNWRLPPARFAWAWMAAILVVSILAGGASLHAQDDDRRKVVVCSTTQTADFARQIVGDRWEVVCVLSAAEDPHTYDITPADIEQIKRADLCVQNGWNLEGHDWMGTQARNQNKPLVTCVQGVKPLIVQEPSGEESTEAVNDPHAWFDIDNAMIYVTNIRNAIRDLDPDHADEYNARAKLYLLQLRVLKQWVASEVNAIPKERRILVTHHDAFGYFARANGFRAESPVGWTTGELTGISIGQRQQVVDQIRKLGVKSIFVETSTETETLKSIAEETGIKIGGSLYSDAMGAPGTAGETYIGMVRENVLTIVNSLK